MQSVAVVLVVVVVVVAMGESNIIITNDDEFQFLLNTVLRFGTSLETVKARMMQSRAPREAWFDSSRSPSLLHAACSRGDARVVQFILEEAKKYFSITQQKNKKKNTTNSKKTMNLEEYLVQRDFESGHSAMHRCLLHGPNLTCARTLLKFATEH